MSKDRTWRDLRAELMQTDDGLRSEYRRNGAHHMFVAAMISARTDRGWTQRELAEAIGVSQPVIARLERGQRDPRLSTMVAVCDALELPLVIGAPGQRLAG